MFQILYFNGGVRKTKEIQDFHKACEEAVVLDLEGHLVSSVNKINREGKVVKNVWELRDDENTKEAFKRLRALAETSKAN